MERRSAAPSRHGLIQSSGSFKLPTFGLGAPGVGNAVNADLADMIAEPLRRGLSQLS